jgi:CRISPR associated protein Cas1/LysE type translocator
MQDREYRTYSTARNPREIVTVTGQGVSLRVRRHQLEITDGFPLEAPQETRRITRAVERVQRILLSAGSGFATLDALDWAAENGAPIVACDQGGHLRWVLIPGEGGQWKTKLRRAQAAALHESTGLELVRFLIETKLHKQAEVLRDALARLGTRTDAVIRNAAGALVQLLNPKTALFFYAFLPQFVDPTKGGAVEQILVLGALFAMLAFCTDSAYALLAGTVGQWLHRHAPVRRARRYVTGSIYIGLGMTAALAGAERK